MPNVKSDKLLTQQIQKLWKEQQQLYALANKRGLSNVESRRLDELRLTLRELWQRTRAERGTFVPPK